MPRDNDLGRLLGALRGLPQAAPDARSTERMRARAHAILARQHQDDARAGVAARVIDGGLLLVCVGYLSGAVAQALRLFSDLR